MSYSLDNPAVEKFLTEWYSFGNHQFGQFRNKHFDTLAGYKKYIMESYADKKPAFSSVQPQLKITNIFYEFDADIDADEYRYDMPELDEVWNQTLMLSQMIKNKGGNPIILYSGRRGYHIYGRVFNRKFKADDEDRVREFYKKILFGVMIAPDMFPDFDRLPTHINALSRMPFSYHQKTGKQVVPLTMSREPYIPVLYKEFVNMPLDGKWVMEQLSNTVYNPEKRKETSEIDFGNFNIRPCIVEEMMLNSEHNTRLAYVLDAIYAGVKDEEMHQFFDKYCEDYKRNLTQYHFDDARKNVKTRRVKPCSCNTLKRWGICKNQCKKTSANPWTT
jgi:hypothetical protein